MYLSVLPGISNGCDAVGGFVLAMRTKKQHTFFLESANSIVCTVLISVLHMDTHRHCAIHTEYTHQHDKFARFVVFLVYELCLFSDSVLLDSCAVVVVSCLSLVLWH